MRKFPASSKRNITNPDLRFGQTMAKFFLWAVLKSLNRSTALTCSFLCANTLSKQCFKPAASIWCAQIKKETKANQKTEAWNYKPDCIKVPYKSLTNILAMLVLRFTFHQNNLIRWLHFLFPRNHFYFLASLFKIFWLQSAGCCVYCWCSVPQLPCSLCSSWHINYEYSVCFSSLSKRLLQSLTGFWLVAAGQALL